MPVELGMADEAGIVINDRDQVGSFFSFRAVRFWQVRSVHDIGLPDLVGMIGLE